MVGAWLGLMLPATTPMLGTSPADAEDALDPPDAGVADGGAEAPGSGVAVGYGDPAAPGAITANSPNWVTTASQIPGPWSWVVSFCQPWPVSSSIVRSGSE